MLSGAAAALATGIALVLRGRAIVDETARDARAAFDPTTGTTGMDAGVAADQERQGRALQGGGYASLAAAGLLSAAAVVLWLFRRRHVDTRREDSLLSVPF